MTVALDYMQSTTSRSIIVAATTMRTSFIGGVLLTFWAAAANATCRCPEAATSRHLLLAIPPAAVGTAGLVACGYEDGRSGDTIVASEFQIFRCGGSTPLLDFGALQTARLRPVGAALEVVEVQRWPFGSRWEWISVPVYQWRISCTDSSAGDRRTLRLQPSVRPSEILKFLRVYNSWVSTPASARSYQSTEEFVARLFTATVAGDRDAEKLFLRMRDDVGLDGAAAEIYSMAMHTYDAWRDARARASKD